MHKAIRYSFFFIAILALVAGIGWVWFVTNFSGFKDSFRGDSHEGRMQLYLDGIKGDERGIAERNQMLTYGGQVAIIGIPTMQLPTDAQAVFSVALPKKGYFNEGGGWIFTGRKYYGTHPVAGEFLSAESDHPDILHASVDPVGRLRLKALAPGSSTISVSARRMRRNAQDRKPPTVTDSVEFVVLPTELDP